MFVCHGSKQDINMLIWLKRGGIFSEDKINMPAFALCRSMCMAGKEAVVMNTTVNQEEFSKYLKLCFIYGSAHCTVVKDRHKCKHL